MPRRVVDISLDAGLLRLAGRFMGDKTAEEKTAKEILAGIGGIYVRSFSFDSDNAYSKADIDKVRRQLAAPGWSRLVTVRSQRERPGRRRLHAHGRRTKIDGMVIVAYAPRAFTVVNIVGSVDLEKLRQLEGKFGVPPGAGGEIDCLVGGGAPATRWVLLRRLAGSAFGRRANHFCLCISALKRRSGGGCTPCPG